MVVYPVFPTAIWIPLKVKAAWTILLWAVSYLEQEASFPLIIKKLLYPLTKMSFLIIILFMPPLKMRLNVILFTRFTMCNIWIYLDCTLCFASSCFIRGLRHKLYKPFSMFQCWHFFLTHKEVSTIKFNSDLESSNSNNLIIILEVKFTKSKLRKYWESQVFENTYYFKILYILKQMLGL